jgi:hypothetical protein
MVNPAFSTGGLGIYNGCMRASSVAMRCGTVGALIAFDADARRSIFQFRTNGRTGTLWISESKVILLWLSAPSATPGDV